MNGTPSNDDFVQEIATTIQQLKKLTDLPESRILELAKENNLL